MADFHWRPIAPLSDTDRRIDLADMRSIYATWQSSRHSLGHLSKASLSEFTRRLIRRLSIETGILERLYDLDRGTTEALVAQGFVEELVSRSSTDIEPARLIDILRDQEAAIQLVMDCVVGKRDLTKSVIHELHSILVRHQETTTAIDQFGKRQDIALLKGYFKQHANNPRRPDGSIHEYCPPIHVESEMDNLLRWLADYSDDDPVIVATWLHHRFTQIHPYQDGNGRVARALTTLVLLRAQLLPLVIDRDMRSEYIVALEKADGGDLAPLARIFAGLERNAILQALSVDVDAEVSHYQSLTSAVLDALNLKFGRRRASKDAELRSVNDIALRLRAIASHDIEAAYFALAQTIASIAAPARFTDEGGPDRGNAHWYRFEVIKTAKEAGKFANFDENHYFVKASIRVERERLVFVVSFHHIGRELSGIMEATAFARLESFEESEERQSVSHDFFICSIEPFVFTYQTQEEGIRNAFSQWLDAALAVAFKEYGDRL